MAARRSRLKIAPNVASREKAAATTEEKKKNDQEEKNEGTEVNLTQQKETSQQEETEKCDKEFVDEVAIATREDAIEEVATEKVTAEEKVTDGETTAENVDGRSEQRNVIADNAPVSTVSVKPRSRFVKAKPNLAASRRINSAQNASNIDGCKVADVAVVTPKPLPVQRLTSLSDFPPEPVGSSISCSNDESESPRRNNQLCDERTVQLQSRDDEEQRSRNEAADEEAKALKAKQNANIARRQAARKKHASLRRNFNDSAQAPPERSRMTMFDLIYWNPTDNPMTEREVDRLETSRSINDDVDDDTRAETPIADLNNNDEDNDVDGDGDGDDEEQSENAMPVPQVKLAADGSIIVDEQSLVIENPVAKKSLDNSPVIYENAYSTTYSSFRRTKNGRFWDVEETKKFYTVLNHVGTDFSMMAKFFPKRTRHELKLKFNREDRLNKELIDKAINEPQQFDSTVLEELLSEHKTPVKTNKSRVRRGRGRGRGRSNKLERGKGRPPIANKTKRRKGMYISEDEESEIESVEISPDAELIASAMNDDDDDKSDDKTSDEIEGDDVIANKVSRPTRSGRQPKRPSTFLVPETSKRKKQSTLTSSDAKSLRNHLQETVTFTPPASRAAEGSLVFVPSPKNSNTQVIHIYRISPLSQTFVVPTQASTTTQDKNSTSFPVLLPISPHISPGQQIIITPTTTTSSSSTTRMDTESTNDEMVPDVQS